MISEKTNSCKKVRFGSRYAQEWFLYLIGNRTLNSAADRNSVRQGFPT